jgi:hypothetical protein
MPAAFYAFLALRSAHTTLYACGARAAEIVKITSASRVS